MFLSDHQSSHCVVLLNSINIQSLELHHRFDMTFQRMQLSQPRNLRSPFCLLCNLRKLSVTAFLRKQSRGFWWWLKAVQSPLRRSPLSFSLFFPIVGLGSESSLYIKNDNMFGQRSNSRLYCNEGK